MAVKFQDYYEILGIPRDAAQEQIQSAYRKLARKYHPDINKEKDAEDKFKKISEAYEVLKDPEKRKKYDTLGANWKTGDDFTPPPGWEQWQTGSRHGTGPQSGFDFGFDFGDMGTSFGSGFSDFFESFFGDAFQGFRTTRSTHHGAGGGFQSSTRGQDQEAELTITVEEAYTGTKKNITLSYSEVDEAGRIQQKSKTLDVTIPSGITDGKRLRLSGQGSKGGTRGTAGDLYLRIHIAPHHRFRVKGADIEIDTPIAPWEAALGAEITVPLVQGSAKLKIQPGIQSGQRLRVKGKGLKENKNQQGDFYAVVKIVVPKNLSSEERELYNTLSKISTFKPRPW